MNADKPSCRRKERRFKTTAGQTLHCECFAEDDDQPKQGTIVDISPSGLRILTDGQFKIGQEFSAELKTDRSHGTYRGVIRRAVPWVGGNTILGCQLTDKIPNAVLQCLAHEGIVNRRRDQRFEWNQPAALSWELKRGEIEIEIKDCSRGGLRICSPQPVPDNARLRIRVEMGEEELLVIDARTVWQTEYQNGWMAGLSFIHKQVPEAVARYLASQARETAADQPGSRRLLRPSLLVASVLVTFAVALLEIALSAR